MKNKYDEMLDNLYPSITIGNIKFTASQILKKCDPIAYDCGLADFENNKN